MNRPSVRELVLGVAIAVLACWYGISELWPGGASASAQAAVVAPMPELGSSSTDSTEDLLLPEALRPKRADAAAMPWPENPFDRSEPVTAGPEKIEDSPRRDDKTRFVLNAIVSGDSPLAMIDGKVFAVGDSLCGEYKVAAIDSESVRLEGPGGTRILGLAK